MRGKTIQTHLSVFLLFFLVSASLLAGCGAGRATPTPMPPSAVPATATATVPPVTPTPANKLVTGTNGLPWWNDSVFYEIFVRSFADSNGDGIGDFNGITQKLDYLEKLGIRGLWLMPINPSPSYHGYDVTDYYAVNKDYGTLDDFKRLLSEAHKRGIRVIMDLVINHTSDQHPWFQEARDPKSKYRSWYIWSETDPGFTGPSGQTVWHPTANGFYYGVFVAQMPDLNYQNPEVTKEMEKVTKFWLDLGLDGYRIDAAKQLIEEGKAQENTKSTIEWFKKFKPLYKKINPQAMVVGEVWSNSYSAVQFIRTEGMDLVFDFDLASGWVSGALNGNADKLMGTTVNENDIFKGQQLATFLTNHDMNRVMSQMMGNVEKARAAATVYLTSPGVPFVYYGEEIGMSGSKPDEKIRTPMQWTAAEKAGFTTGNPWEAINSDYPQVNVDIQSKDPRSIYSHYQKLIQARNQHEALRVGELIKVDTGSPKVYAMLRKTEKEAVLVLINLDKEANSSYSLSLTSSTLKGTFAPQALVGEGTFTNLKLDDQGGINAYQPLASLPANANLVLLLKPAP